MLRAVVLHENTAETPSEEEIRLYASSIGIGLPEEAFLLPIAREGISAALPKGWQILQDENNEIFYYNSVSGKSIWEHPLDSVYKKRVEEARKARNNNTFTEKGLSTDEPSKCATPIRDQSFNRKAEDSNFDAPEGDRSAGKVCL
ncbi:hypothetical protein D915_010480 [Fasciola hepatica]|uniref:WW domain-containing protein n=1 Tax=Fasciola hepatica TaxID=6192 RepID=A0A4E0QVP9_FASHE|nr:hypothetical protein D915_010480 [Fasciola hepatica]